MKTDGLYITLGPDGTIKRYLRDGDSKIPLDDTTIAEEIINLSEQNHIHLYQAIKEIWALAGRTGDAAENNTEFAIAMETFLHRLRKENIIRYTLLMTQIADHPNDRPFAHWNAQESGMFIANNFSQAMAADITVGRVLFALSDGLPLDLDDEHDMLRRSSAYVTFSFDDSLTAEYQFRSEEQYFIFLLQHFILSKPNVAVCQFCGRYFIPKTRKKTLYCDRVVRNGRSCKRVAPHLKRKEKISASRVLTLFKRVKEMMEKRYDRTGDDKAPSIIDITYEQYFEWLLLATDARDRYLAGELTEDKAISIIYVPKKDELLENNSADYILETADTTS
ncbi:MAG: hypothetical protein IKT52_04350 [Oscillospiraceae bacterium]|nr:hypothetical protein [Oscillospiraceae bacterium]